MVSDKQILQLMKQGKSNREICEELHVSDRRTKRVRLLHQDVSNTNYRNRLSDIEHRYKLAIKEIADLKNQNDLTRIFNDASRVLLPKDFAIQPNTEDDAVANLCLGDWHIDEEVDGNRINGVNEFNLKIRDARIEKLLNSTREIVEMCRSKSKIETMIVYLLGDFISNNIHEDLMETNTQSPIKAALTLYEILVGVFNFLLKDEKLSTIVVPCVCGNHSRITKKIRVKTFNGNNLEYLIYHLLAKYYENEKRIFFRIPEGYFCLTNVYNFKIRSSHGHYINYKDGVGGVTIPLNKAIDKWSKAIKVDLDILGHWHQRICMPRFVLNGCLIGYSEFAERVKAEPEPPSQSFFLTTQKYVKTTEVPIFL